MATDPEADYERRYAENEAQLAAKGLTEQAMRRICNECSHTWTQRPIGSTNDPDWLAAACEVPDMVKKSPSFWYDGCS